MKLNKTSKALLIGVSLLLVGVPLLALSLTKVEMTPNGVHTRLLVPAGPNTDVGIHIYSGTGDSPRIARFLDGPVVRPAANGAWKATWFCESEVHHRTGNSDDLDIECAGNKTSYPVRARQQVPPSTIPLPARMLVLSDIEGNAAFLDAALRELGVLDEQGRWTYGSNHLVIAGDAVDRGRDVFAVLWRVYSLSLQATEQGGAVHMLLGNHEQYMLRGNMSRANREHIHTLERMGGAASAFGADTVLGAWLRQQPVVLQAGRVLVTHAGISPMLLSHGVGVAELNDAQRRYWQGATAPAPALDAVFGPEGVTQYRGYFQAIEGSYARATPAQVADVLSRFGADTIVVGHTLVEHITPMYGGRVYAVDVNSVSAASQALLFENGSARIVPLQARRALTQANARLLTRPLRLLDPEDRQTLTRFVQRTRALSQLSYPY